MPSLATRSAYANIQQAEIRLTDAIDGSWTEPSSVLIATAVSTVAAKIEMIAHTRRYLDGRSVSVSSATISSSLALGTQYGLHYTDGTRRSTAPTVTATTAIAQAANNYARGRHFVDIVTTPATTSSTATSGGGTRPAGGFDTQIP